MSKIRIKRVQTERSIYKSPFDKLLDSKRGMILVSILAFAMALFFILIPGQYQPISREDAIAYTGQFRIYESSKNYCYICFTDGSEYEVYPHTETWKFRDMIEALPEGTTLHLLINPDNDYVLEIRTDSDELMNFDAEQQEINSYVKGYVWIGVFLIVCAAFLLWFAFQESASKKREDKLKKKKLAKRADGFEDAALRRADFSKKHRVLLKKKIGGYEICYCRIKNVNELVINGSVYDERKAIVEFEHTLSASIDGHLIEAGLDDESFSFIAFDEKIVAKKKRLI